MAVPTRKKKIINQTFFIVLPPSHGIFKIPPSPLERGVRGDDDLFQLLQVKRLYQIALNPCLQGLLPQSLIAMNSHQNRNKIRFLLHPPTQYI